MVKSALAKINNAKRKKALYDAMSPDMKKALSLKNATAVKRRRAKQAELKHAESVVSLSDDGTSAFTDSLIRIENKSTKSEANKIKCMKYRTK